MQCSHVVPLAEFNGLLRVLQCFLYVRIVYGKFGHSFRWGFDNSLHGSNVWFQTVQGAVICTSGRHVRIVTSVKLKRSPLKAWSGSVDSLTCYAYCQRFLPCLFLPFRSIHLHFFQNLSRFFLCWLLLAHGSCVGPQNRIGLPAGCRFPCVVPAEYK